MINIKICFIGFGSIAKRHIDNTIQLFAEKDKVIIDLFRSSDMTSIPEGYKDKIHQIYTVQSEMPKDYDVIFITNPTQCHYDTLCKFHNNGEHFFIEKPVFDRVDINISNIGLRENSVYYVACPLRYTNVIQFIKENINMDDIYSIRSISSSYLPDWRPGQDYRKTYSAHKNLGGGVAIDLIHEWDYLHYLLGSPEKVFQIKSKVSNLEIDSEDIAIYIASYSNKTVELHLDYFGRKPIRRIELYGRDDTIIGDLIAGEIIYLNSGETVQLTENRNDFQKKELEYFYSLISKDKVGENANDIGNAYNILKLVKGEEK